MISDHILFARQILPLAYIVKHKIYKSTLIHCKIHSLPDIGMPLGGKMFHKCKLNFLCRIHFQHCQKRMLTTIFYKKIYWNFHVMLTMRSKLFLSFQKSYFHRTIFCKRFKRFIANSFAENKLSTVSTRQLSETLQMLTKCVHTLQCTVH